MGSNAALLGAAGYGPYAAAKEAIRALTRVAAREWGKHGIIVNCVCPVSAAHRAPPADDAGPASRSSRPLTKTFRSAATVTSRKTSRPVVAFLLSEGCRYMTGQTFMVDGGALMRV